MYGFMSNVRPNSIFLSIFPPELPVPLNRLNWIVKILGDLSMVNCFRARTFLRQWLQWYLLSPSRASTAVKRFKALVRESARTISRLKSSRGSYVLEQVEQTVHLTCNDPADGQLTAYSNKVKYPPCWRFLFQTFPIAENWGVKLPGSASDLQKSCVWDFALGKQQNWIWPQEAGNNYVTPR